LLAGLHRREGNLFDGDVQEFVGPCIDDGGAPKGKGLVEVEVPDSNDDVVEVGLAGGNYVHLGVLRLLGRELFVDFGQLVNEVADDRMALVGLLEVPQTLVVLGLQDFEEIVVGYHLVGEI